MQDRRQFLQSATSSAVSAASLSAATHAWAAAGDSDIRIALIGCGGRGTGACAQALAAGSTIRLVAVVDPLEGQAEQALQTLKERHEAQVDVPPDQVFTGLQDYAKAFELADVVLITTPPGPRPQLFEAAIAAGKHVFMEKPVATDGPGIRQVLRAAEQAKQKRLNVCVGLQRRYDPGYQEMIEGLQQGAIGELLQGRVYWNGTSRPGYPREAGEDELHYQIRNWYFFTWMSGDHILEQHVHNLDVALWALDGKLPIRAMGQGGRQVRNAPENGTIFDHHTVEFEYENGFRLLSQCCQIGGKCHRDVSEHFLGRDGTASLGNRGRFLVNGEMTHRSRERFKPDPYQLEHDRFFENIRTGGYRNDAVYAAHATLMGLMGRMATYTGQVITLDQARSSQQQLVPELLDWDTPPPVLPDADGRYPVAIPGTTLPL